MSTFVRGGGGAGEKVKIDGVKVVNKMELTSYKGANPLTIGQAGVAFPANTLILEDFDILNGVNGEDLTDTVADQTTAVANLLKMVGRKIADHKGEGQYVWKKLTAEGGEFVDFVVSADTGAYPDGGTQDGFYYVKFDPLTAIAENIREGVSIFDIIGTMSEGVSGIDYGSVTLAEKTKTFTVAHSLNVAPKAILVIPLSVTFSSQYLILGDFVVRSTFTPSSTTKRQGWIITFYKDSSALTLGNVTSGNYSTDYTLGTSAITINHSIMHGYAKGSYLWIAVA